MASTTSRTLRAKFDGDTSGLAAAAKRGEKIVDDFGKNAGRGMGDSFEQEFERGGKRGFLSAALSGASGFAETLTNGIKNLKGPLIAAAVVGIVAAMPIIGSLAAGGLVLAFGAGLAGLGLVFAAKAPAVVAAFTKLKDDIGKQLREISKPFESTLLVIEREARETFGKFLDPLREAFADIAPALSRFAGNIGDALGELAPVIGPISDAFVAILDALGPELPGIVEGIAEGITAIADSIADNPDTFVSLVVFLFDVVEWGLKFIAVLSDIANWFNDNPDVTAPLKSSFWGLLGPIGLVIGALGNAKEAWDDIKGIFGKKHTAKIEGDSRGWRKTLSDAFEGAKKWARSVATSKITAAADGLWSVLRGAYQAVAKWARSSWNATLGAINKVAEVLGEVEELGRRWAGKVFNATFGAIKGGGVPFLPGLASGGTASPGRQYLVGENGPEVLTMGASGGVVTPNHKLSEVGGDTHVYVTIDGEQLQGRITKTVRDRDRGVKRALGAGGLRMAPA